MNTAKQIAEKLNVPIEIVKLAVTALGREDKVEAWLTTPIPALNGDIPISMLNTHEGSEMILTILRKIECGEFI